MKRIFWAAALSLLASCGVVEDELYQSGGYLGGKADGFIEARTPHQRFDRYMIVALILAPTALETAIDEEESIATIRRVNALYRSLTALRRSIECTDYADVRQPDVDGVNLSRPAVESGDTDNPFYVVCENLQSDRAANWTEANGELAANGYSFETLENAVQQDLFFIARAVVTNLELNIEVENLVNFNPTSLFTLWRKVEELLPMFRQTAARYRSGVIMYADIAQASCDPSKPTCQQLRNLMAARFAGSDRLEKIPEHDVRRMLRLANASFNPVNWGMTAPQYAAIIWQIDQSCFVAEDRQSSPRGRAEDDKAHFTCSPGSSVGDDTARGAFIAALGGPAVGSGENEVSNTLESAQADPNGPKER